MNNITAVVLTKNEESGIRECLESIAWMDAFVIVDSGSTDRTLDICREFTNRIFTRELDGFGPQRNFAIEQVDTEWVLTIDADERMTDELRAEIQALYLDKSDEVAYYVPRLNYMFGKPVRYTGWYPDYTTPRLFLRDKCRYHDAPVHEKMDVDGSVAYLKSDLIHYNYQTVSDFVDRLNLYTSLDARKMKQDGKRFSLDQLFTAVVTEFGWRFFLQYGYRDGVRGLILSGLMAFYRFVSYAKLWEFKKADDAVQDTHDARRLCNEVLRAFVRAARDLARTARYALRLDCAQDATLTGLRKFIAKAIFYIDDKVRGKRYHD